MYGIDIYHDRERKQKEEQERKDNELRRDGGHYSYTEDGVTWVPYRREDSPTYDPLSDALEKNLYNNNDF